MYMIQFVFNNFPLKLLRRYARSMILCGAINRKVAGSIPDSVIGIFNFFRPHYGSGVDFAYNRNEFEEYFLAVKAASR